MIAGLPWTTWLVLLAAVLIGPAIVLRTYFKRRADQAESSPADTAGEG